jgi:hypothetical protein
MKTVVIIALIAIATFAVGIFTMPKLIMLSGEKSEYRAGARSFMPTLILTGAVTALAYKVSKGRKAYGSEGRNEKTSDSSTDRKKG